MPILNEMLNFEYESEYDLSQKKLYSDPKIYSANGDLSKRWYVYFSYRNPETGKLKRLAPIYGTVNTHKTKEARLSILVAYRKSLLKFLKQGYNPYKDNSELYKNEIDVQKQENYEQIETAKKENIAAIIEESKMTLKEAFDFALKLKEKLIGEKTRVNYENRIKNFLKWMSEKHPEVKTIHELNKKIVSSFLNEVLDRTSARTRNNARVDLSSLMQVLEDNDIIENNFIKRIPVLKSIPERNKTYTKEIQEDIFKYLEDEDPILLLYIKFISYNFLRPIEVCRLKVGDINLKNNTIQFKAKNSPFKTKIIPEMLISELPDLSKLDKDLVLFTPEKIGGLWNASVENRRDYFTKQFKKVVKDHFGLGKDYGLYSFRHTFITKLYREIVKKSSPFAAKSTLMQITGHSSMAALEKYLRDIDAELPADYSEMLK